jgi:hypothetical protein
MRRPFGRSGSRRGSRRGGAGLPVCSNGFRRFWRGAAGGAVRQRPVASRLCARRRPSHTDDDPTNDFDPLANASEEREVIQ